jgi:hypothetical protein
MTIIVWIFALLAATIHIVVFAWEAFLSTVPACMTESSAFPTSQLCAFGLSVLVSTTCFSGAAWSSASSHG